MHTFFGLSGRINRDRYWLGQFFNGTAFALAMILLWAGGRQDGANALMVPGFAALAFAMSVNISSAVRRLHDRNRSGAWFLIILIPFVGPILLLIECGFRRGTDGENRFGPPPEKGKETIAGIIDCINCKAMAACVAWWSREAISTEDAHGRQYDGTPRSAQERPILSGLYVPSNRESVSLR